MRQAKTHPIYVTSGTGSGPTSLAAFDAALYSAGIANHNLIHLSSIIPPGAKPVMRKLRLNTARGEFGNRLYVVYASKIETDFGKSAWAGLGWTMARMTNPGGLFVEHVGENEPAVIQQIKLTLASMAGYRRETYGRIQCKTAGIHCTDTPVCALVAAVYASVPWNFT